MNPTRAQFAGCLVGQCLGDALGFVVEGHSPDVCQEYVTTILRSGRAGEVDRSRFPFGQYSDDSQLARELMESYVACRGFSPADYAHRIADLFATNRVVGRGRATEQAAERLLHGVPWDQAGTPPPSAGNGSAMRAGPVGVLFGHTPSLLIATARDQGHITHQDRRCAAGSVVIAGAVAFALQPGPVDPTRFLSELANLVQDVETTFAAALRQLVERIALPPEQAAAAIAPVGLAPGQESDWHSISPFVLPSVLWSLYAFCARPAIIGRQFVRPLPLAATSIRPRRWRAR